MSHRISAASRPASAVFFYPFLLRLWLPELLIANLFGDDNQLLDDFAEAMVFIELFAGTLHGGTGGDDVSDRLARDGVCQRIRGTVARTFLGAVTGRFAALAEAWHQRTGSHITDGSQLSLQLVALQQESLEIWRSGCGHI